MSYTYNDKCISPFSGQNYTNNSDKGESRGSMRESISNINALPFAIYSKRGIRPEVYKTFGVRMACSEETGEITDIYFPYYDQQGKLTGYKRKDLTKEKYDKCYITTIGKVSTNCKMFGQHVCDTINRPKEKSPVYIVEGEEDVLSCHQAVLDFSKGGKFEGSLPYVVGLNCGTPNTTKTVAYNKSFLDSFSKIILGFDNDEAVSVGIESNEVRGKEATEMFPSEMMKNNLHVAKFEFPHKDPNDYIVAGESAALAKILLFNYQPYTTEKILSVSDISFERFITPRPEGLYVHSFPKLMDKIHGFRKRELVVITSPVGTGKSSVTSEIAYCLAAQAQKVGMIFLEEEENETLQRQGARHLNVKFNDFKAKPTARSTVDELKDAYSWLGDKFFFLDHFGSIQIETLMAKIKSFVYQTGVDYILLDHLSMCVSGIDTKDERKLLDMIMTELAAFCANHDVGIIAVTHLNRTVSDGFKKAKKADTNEPYWLEVSKEQMRGSSALEALSWIVLGLEPEILPSKERGRVRLTVLKNRPWSYLGVADTFKMDEETGLFINCEDGCIPEHINHSPPVKVPVEKVSLPKDSVAKEPIGTIFKDSPISTDSTTNITTGSSGDEEIGCEDLL